MPNEVQDMIASNQLTMGHARVLSKLSDDEEIIQMAHNIVENKLPVRDVEKASFSAPRKRAQKKEREKRQVNLNMLKNCFVIN
ncbi:MAG: hypothetical protein V8R01_02145 [Bacilli bacterium]